MKNAQGNEGVGISLQLLSLFGFLPASDSSQGELHRAFGSLWDAEWVSKGFISCRRKLEDAYAVSVSITFEERQQGEEQLPLQLLQ